jgi:hypothetical protein
VACLTPGGHAGRGEHERSGSCRGVLAVTALEGKKSCRRVPVASRGGAYGRTCGTNWGGTSLPPPRRPHPRARGRRRIGTHSGWRC